MAQIKEYFVFHDSNTTESNGKTLIIRDEDILSLEIKGEVDSIKIICEGQVTPSLDFLPISAINLKDFTTAWEITTVNSIWQLERKWSRNKHFKQLYFNYNRCIYR